MYFDIKINDEPIFEDVQGETFNTELYDFIEKTTGTVPTYRAYEMKAVDFATWLAARHTAILSADGDVDFKEDDALYYEGHRHFGKNDTANMTNEEVMDAFNQARILFGRKINDDDILKATIS